MTGSGGTNCASISSPLACAATDYMRHMMRAIINMPSIRVVVINRFGVWRRRLVDSRALQYEMHQQLALAIFLIFASETCVLIAHLFYFLKSPLKNYL